MEVDFIKEAINGSPRMAAQGTHAAAVDAVTAWMALALHALAPLPLAPTAAEVAHTTACTVTAQWIQSGLEHVQMQTESFDADDQRDGGTVTQSDGNGEAEDTATREDETLLALEAVRSMAESVASAAIERVVAQLLFDHDNVKHECAVASKPMPIVASVLSDATTCVLSSCRESEAPSLPEIIERHAATLALEVETPIKLDLTGDDGRESRVQVATNFVSSLFDAAIHHHHTTIQITTSPPPATPPPSLPPPLDLPPRTPTPPYAQESQPNAPLVPNETSPPLGSSSSSIDKPPTVLAAVKPPKQGVHRPPQRKPMPVSIAVTTSSPRIAPVERPPKTGDHTHDQQHPQLRPISGRTPRTSPRLVSHDHESTSSQSPPRLRKLEEYLEMHPVDRAKKIYRPRRPPQIRHPLDTATHHGNGYDAEHEESDDELEGATTTTTPPPPRVKLVPLRGAVNPAHPTLPSATISSSAASSSSADVVDRPDRLGLLNKPKRRSGFCQQCGFDGRSCKVSDCLKHQPLR